MKSWFTTSELAALALPGLPSTRQGWETLAERDGWAEVANMARPRSGRGGGFEYHLDLLPAAALAAFASRAVGAVKVEEKDRIDAEAAAETAILTTASLDHRDARLALLAAAERCVHAGNFSRGAADKAFCALYNLGKIEVDSWVRAAVPELAPRSIARWRALRAKGEIGRLAIDKGAARRGRGALDQPDVRSWLLGFLAHKPHTSAQSALDYLTAKFPNLDISLRSVRRALSELKSTEKVALARITNPDAWKSKYETSGENSNAVSRLNELWMIDASPADAMLIDGRYSIYACIDRYSRRTIIYVTKTPRAEAVCLLLRRALIAWGVPERIKTDNGSDFKARRTVGLMNALEIEINVSRPYDPKAKAHVERVIKTFQHDCASDLPGFVGHSVADRKVIEERKSFAERMGQTDDKVFSVELTAKAFQAECDHWAGVRYEHREHGALGRKSPFQKAAEYVGKIKRIEDIRALDMLIAPVAGGDGIRTVSKGRVRVDNANYYTGTVLTGERVFVRMDPADLGHVYLFTPDGLNFLGEGLCPELAGVTPEKVVAETKRQQAELQAEHTTEIRRSHRQIKKDKPALVAEIKRRELAAAGKVVAFPRASDVYTTPALGAAANALRGSDPTLEDTRAALQAIDETVDGLRGEVERDLAGVQAAPGENVRALRKDATPQQRMARARDIFDRIAHGVEVSTAEAVWLGAYQRQPEFIGVLGSPSERFKHTLLLGEVRARGEPLWPHEEAWLKGYEAGAEYQASRLLYEEFGKEALR
jgi:transposase InsO family protein